jgi:molybdopterin-biosynthesis enzyme MoeA-like protein
LTVILDLRRSRSEQEVAGGAGATKRDTTTTATTTKANKRANLKKQQLEKYKHKTTHLPNGA